MVKARRLSENKGTKGTVGYVGPEGGLGSPEGTARIFGKEWDSPAALQTLRRQKKPKGFMSVSCSWAKRPAIKSGKAESTVPDTLMSTGFVDAPYRYRLLTICCNDRFNTTICGYSDRLSGFEGASPEGIGRTGLREGQMISLVSDADNGIHREVGLLRATPLRLPEMDPLIPLAHHDIHSKTPAVKSVPLRIRV